MRTQLQHNHSHDLLGLHNNVTTPVDVAEQDNGLISEWVYNGQQPTIARILLPLLQQLAAQSRWLLWLSPPHKLSKSWLEKSSLPVNKVVQLCQHSPISSVEAMEKALSSGNYSAVLAWLPAELTHQERLKLQQAAEHGNAYGFIMRPQDDINPVKGQSLPLKIHSFLYH